MPTKCWISDALQRHFPAGQAGGKKTLHLKAVRGERAAFQVCAKHLEDGHAEISAGVRAPDGLAVSLRRVGCVPVPHQNTGCEPAEVDGLEHLPGYVPDVLFEDATATVGPREIQCFWVSVDIPRDAVPGPREVGVEVVAGNRSYRLKAVIDVADMAIEPRRDFPVTHWLYTDALCDWYGLKPFSKSFWPLCRRYMQNLLAHGTDVIHTPLFTPPTDGVKRPTQLVRVKAKKGRYDFDWTDVETWVAQAKDVGFGYFEWPHLFSQWGVDSAIRIYKGQGNKENLLWPPDTGATSETYRGFLSQFLPQFERFLRTWGIFDVSFFHVSDEPHGDEHLENYKAARALLAELAPWMRTMDALSDIRYGREKLTDTPIPTIRTTRQYYDEGIPSWTYFCCGPRGRYLNRLLDTPLPKIRMSGWLFYRFQRMGFLHWGYNYWYKSQTRELIDPFTVTDGLKWPNWAYGDTAMVYPGPEGPLDSIRWEVFAQSLQDYRLLQTAGVDPEGELLEPLRDFDDFPGTTQWIAKARESILQGTHDQPA